MRNSAPIKHFLEDPSRSLVNFRYRLRELWRSHTASVNENPIFVFGNQKSGTSAIAALLGEATGLSYTIDILCLYDGLEERLLRNECSFNEVIDKTRYYFSQDIIKDPGFTFFYEELAHRFPNSKKVFVLRDPRQNIRSILNRLDIPGNLIDLSPEHWQKIKHSFPSWYPVIEGGIAGHKGENYIATLALRCQRIFKLYRQHQTEVVTIKYEDFNQDKVQQIANLARQLGLEINHNIDRIKDVQFQPKGNIELSLEDFFGLANLKRIQEICREDMVALGYPLQVL